MDKVALIAGKGKLPYYWVKTAVKNDIKPYIFKIAEEDTLSFDKYTNKSFEIELGQIDRLFELLHEYGLKKVVFAGKVEKNNLFQLDLDQRMKKILAGLKDYNDDTILRAIAAEFAKEGIKVISQSYGLDDFLVKVGKLNDVKIDDKLFNEMEFAFLQAFEIGKLDIGQTVLTKDKTVVAVEAMEGTDKAILRAGEIAGEGVVMAKVCKKEQDMRFDIPTVGLETIKNLQKIGAKALILEADKTFILDEDDFLKIAKRAGIAVYAARYNAGGVRWEG